ncbi:MAG: hypothetical protein IH586_20505, partial [Anaerolineaceae bacterium]|nr:hypothetical protein [Anaerolineaceae bacterium]
FTFLYADLHAHMIALPVTLLALSWAISVLLNCWSWKKWGQFGASFFLGSLAIGTLRPTNTWDWPTFLAVGCVAVIYTAIKFGSASPLRLPWIEFVAIQYRAWVKRVIFALLGVLVLFGLSALLYQPYMRWYAQAYNQIDPWQGAHTPFWSYLTHWGVFLFIIISWLIWETIDWMANTPLSRLNSLRRSREMILLAIVGLFAVMVGFVILGVEIGWLALFLAAWAGVLLLRPGQPDGKRAVLFMIGTALVLTLFVEVAVLRGDIGRMNTVFKFYLQAWSLLGLSAGAALIWLLPAVARAWQPALRNAWGVALVLLVAGAALFPVLGGIDKMTDRAAQNAPHTLDGMAYMGYATYAEDETEMDLSEDYRAIQWVQKNIPGSPVIVEANVPEYRWGNRYTIYTGLSGVVGWNWHQRQQRALIPGDWIFARIEAVKEFYNTTRPGDALAFLQRYRVQYIIVGQLERAVYLPAGLDKFAAFDDKYWQRVYSDGKTSIYKVIQ